MSAVLCSSYYAVLITLHRNFLPTRRNLMQYAGSASVPKAVCASRSCIFLATSMNPVIPPSHHLAIFVQSLFSSAVGLLLMSLCYDLTLIVADNHSPRGDACHGKEGGRHRNVGSGQLCQRVTNARKHMARGVKVQGVANGTRAASQRKLGKGWKAENVSSHFPRLGTIVAHWVKS